MFNTQKISVTDILEVEAGLRAIIRNRYPDISVERGSVLNDLVITALGYLGAAIKTEATSIRERLYLADLQLSDQAESQLLLQDIASNFLVSTVDTPPKRGRVTFRFTSDITRNIPADISLTRGDNFITVKLFDSSASITLTASDYVETEVEGVTYYEYSTLMESVRVGDDVNILAGSFSSSESLVGLDSIFNRTPFVGLNNTEYAQRSLVDRMQYALQSFSFSTQNGIQATLLNEAIPNLIRTLGIGASDPEMQRDIIPSTLSGSKFHSLGMINIVVASRVTLDHVTTGVDTNQIGGKPILGIMGLVRGSVDIPLISDFGTTRYSKLYTTSTGKTSIEANTITEGEALGSGTASINVQDSEELFSNGSSTTNKFSIELPQGDLSVSAVQAIVDNNLPVIQGLIDSDTYNTLASSILAMGATLVQVIVPNLRLTLARGLSTTSVNVNRVRSVISEFINLWSAEYPLSISDLQIRLGLVFSGTITSFTFEGGVTYIAYLPDGRTLPFSSASLLGVEDDSLQLVANSASYQEDLLPMQISNRVLNYFVTNEDISIEVSNV